YQEVSPDQPLYQRVKHLEIYGLLDPKDQAVLDEGKTVTRLELAFYTEKAKANLTQPQLLTTPTPVPTPVPTAAPTPVINEELRREIEELLKELKDESALLKSRLL